MPGDHLRLFKTGQAIVAVTLITRRCDHRTAKRCPRRRIFRPAVEVHGAVVFPKPLATGQSNRPTYSSRILRGIPHPWLLLAPQSDRVTTQDSRRIWTA